MPKAVRRRLVVPLALLCVLAGCKRAQERAVPLSEVVSGSLPRGTRVQTRGIVTYCDPEWRVLFIQSGSAGMYITMPPNSKIQVGDEVKVTGNILALGSELANSSEQVVTQSNPLPVPVLVKNYSTLPVYFSQFVQVTGVVHWVGDKNGRSAVQLSTGKDGAFVYLHHALAEDLPAVGSEVAIDGVAAADFESNGKFRGPKLFSPSAQQIHVIKPGPADLFATPLKALEELKDVSPGTLVHITGEILVQSGGPSVTDGTVTVPLDLTDSASPSGTSDIAGFWTGQGVENAIVRSLSNQLARNGDIVRLTDLKHLSFSEASAHRRVTVRAVVTYADPGWGMLFVQDSSAAAYVDLHGVSVHLQPGDMVDISGVSGPGAYAPQLEQPHIGFVRRAQLPEPVETNLLQENMSEGDSRWCRFRGIVHTARELDGKTFLQIGAGQSDVSVQLPVAMHAEQLIDREVSITGVFGVLFNDRRQAIGHQIFVPSAQFLKVLDNRTGRTDPVSIVSLQRYSPNTDVRHSVTVKGNVVLRADENTIFIQDSTAGIQVRGVASLRVTDGDTVELQGFITNGEYSPVLEHGVVTSRVPGALPKPYAITAKSAMDGHYDSEYVAVRANLAAVRSSPDGAILVLNDGGQLFEALGPASEKLNSLRPGSEVEVRGICRVQVDATRRTVGGFNVAFDSDQSVLVLQMGPWWDTRKITRALFGIVIISALASLWILLLRQKVEMRTRELQSSVEAKRKAQIFDVARNQVLEAIARNAPPPESMEHLALAVEKQIEGALCAIALSPDGKSFLDGKPAPVLVAPQMPEDLQRKMLPILASALVSATDTTTTLANDADVMASLLEIARGEGMEFCDTDLVVAFSGAGELAGLLMVFFRDPAPSDSDNATRVLQSASRLVSLARDHWYMHERLVFDARHDALTGLPNRTVAEDRLEQAMARAQRRKQMFAVLCIDLDGFKSVNDNFGHQAGDELLRVVATRLRARIRHSDTLARIGGDEFLAIIEDCGGDAAARSVGESLVASLHEPLNLEGKTVSISGSVGIAIYPTDGKHASELKRNADQAMYRAKASGRGKICFWSGDPATTKKAAPAHSSLGQ